MVVLKYIDRINSQYKTGISTEHSYRGDLKNLLEALAPDVMVTNEPERIDCGAPDYIITRKNIPVGYIEAKDIGADLSNKVYKEQFDRYKQSLDNLIITDYLTFQFYVNSLHTATICIGEVYEKRISPLTQNFDQFVDLIKNFCTYTGQTITSAQKLSKIMAAKARLLADIIQKAIGPHIEETEVNELQNINLLSQYESFKQVLIHDITPKAFADIYAQTIAYGMFAARVQDPSLENFSRQEAAELIPKSNPFLRKLFQYIAGYDLDDRIKWIVDDLADIFRATNVEEMLRDFGKATHKTDPFIHFYETFLAEYDPKLRKSCGVYYTPEPVVNFIVRAVDDILKSEFALPQGLKDTSMIKVNVPDQRGILTEKEIHQVQILDPAVGTGTFLAEVIKQVYYKFEGQFGTWNQYANEYLIPRLNGFEILMAPYSMAHLKLEMLLKETGYHSAKNQRLRVFLTNSLEEFHQDTDILFTDWLSIEANEANHVKKDTPVMCVVGNPPYRGLSTNKGKWILQLIEEYKYVNGVHFKERKHWLNDDYVKFIRYGQHLIEKNGIGILAFINPHGFLDNPTFRGMRWNLLKAFDKIYTLDLHGNTSKREICPDGSPDMNVFDIMQGVSINIFIKNGKNRINHLGKVLHCDLFGKREYKYDYLYNNSLESLNFQEVFPEEPYYFFVPKNNAGRKEYDNGFEVNKLFKFNTVGFVTANDGLNVSLSEKELNHKISDLFSLQESEWRIKYKRKKDSRDWKYNNARNDALVSNKPENIQVFQYRPFDKRFTLYSGKSRGLYSSPQPKIMQQFISKSNYGIALCKQFKSGQTYQHVFITDNIMESTYISNKTSEIASILPLYIYHDNKGQQSFEKAMEGLPNLNGDILKKFSEELGLSFSIEKETNKDVFTPTEIFDYTYAVLFSPAYREKYVEFLKSNFPRVPYPKDKETFKNLVKLGGELRQIHLFESPVLDKFITTYPVGGSNEVGKVKYESGKVWINECQYFDKAPQVTWDFYIGGYQPAQKWLKDRRGRVLLFKDIMHYQRIIVALNETDRIMKEIDKIDFLS